MEDKRFFLSGHLLNVGDKDLFDYFMQHYRHFFPELSERSVFVRQAATLWQCKAALQRRLTFVSGQAHDPVQPIDTLPCR